jgi:hypothetical protein
LPAKRINARASTVAVAGDEAFVIGTSGQREEPVLIRAPL